MRRAVLFWLSSVLAALLLAVSFPFILAWIIWREVRERLTEWTRWLGKSG